MKNILAFILLACVIISAAEIAYIGTTPRIGEADLDAMMLDYEKVRPLEPKTAPDYEKEKPGWNGDYYFTQENVAQVNEVYRRFFQSRPRAGEVSKNYYGMYLLNPGIIDITAEGVVHWEYGLFSHALEREYPEMMEEIPDKPLFSFSEIAQDPKQQEDLLSYMHKVDDSFPESIEGAEYLVDGRNLTITGNERTIAKIWADDYSCSFRRPGTVKDLYLGLPIERGNETVVHTDYFQKIVSAYGARAASSELLPDYASTICCYSGEKAPEGPIYPGRQLTLMQLGWTGLAEMVSLNSFIMFDDRFGRHMNMTHEEFMTAYAERYGNLLARLSYIESVLDDQPPWSGVYYLAYYPRYQKIWIITKGITEKDLLEAKVLIDDRDMQARALHPFLFVNASPAGGDHSLRIVTPSKTYSTSFFVDESPLTVMPQTIILRQGGNLSFALASITQKPEKILIKEAQISWTLEDTSIEFIGGGLAAKRRVNSSSSGQEKVEINKEIEQYDILQVDAKIPAEIGRKDEFDADATITYVQDGQEKQYLARIRLEAE